tara:strand:- start:597 stop:848 length:252 start_codon:yes stop_codon:yes gene_type:complete
MNADQNTVTDPTPSADTILEKMNAPSAADADTRPIESNKFITFVFIFPRKIIFTSFSGSISELLFVLFCFVWAKGVPFNIFYR